jgi:hypothetical protein
LLGREPERPSDAITPSDLALLDAWVHAGGVAVLAYAAGPGSLDRSTVNAWLASRGAGISIDDRTLEDTSAESPVGHGPPWVAGRRVGDDPLGSVYDSFPLAQNHALRVARGSQALAAVTRSAFVRGAKAIEPRPAAAVAAAVRLGDGLVIVMSRNALAALGAREQSPALTPLQTGALADTRDFLVALARWTRRPAEWAHVPPGGRPRGPTLAALSSTVLQQAPPAMPPPSVDTAQLPDPASVNHKDARATDVPPWIRQAGIRALWTPLLSASGEPVRLDSLVAWLDQAGINLFGGDAQPEVIADSLHHRWEEREAVRRAWKQVTTQLQPTSVAWIPAFDLAGYRPTSRWVDSSRGARGEAIALPCAFDSLYWDAGVVPAYLTLARLAGQARQLVPALALDLAPPHGSQPAGHSMGQEFCDGAWRVALARMGRRGTLDTVPVTERYRALLDAGLLPAYYRELEDLIAARAQQLRDRALRESPGLYFAFRLPELPGDWFTLGLLRGFALPDRPLLLFTPAFETRDVLAAYRARGLNAVHALELPLALVRPTALTQLRGVAFGGNDGFWLPNLQGTAVTSRAASERVRSDSLARLLRRLAR